MISRSHMRTALTTSSACLLVAASLAGCSRKSSFIPGTQGMYDFGDDGAALTGSRPSSDEDYERWQTLTRADGTTVSTVVTAVPRKGAVDVGYVSDTLGAVGVNWYQIVAHSNTSHDAKEVAYVYLASGGTADEIDTVLPLLSKQGAECTWKALTPEEAEAWQDGTHDSLWIHYMTTFGPAARQQSQQAETAQSESPQQTDAEPKGITNTPQE